MHPVQAGLAMSDNCLFQNIKPFRRSNSKFQICSMHRILKGIHIRFRQFFWGIGDFRHAVLTTTKQFSTKTQILFFARTGFGFYGQKCSSVQVSDS